MLPGVLLTAQVLEALGAWGGLQGRPLNAGRLAAPVPDAGAAFWSCPWFFPAIAFPLVWGAWFFLLDPFSDLLGGDSLIPGSLQGERREHLCLLTAGLICGLWWEAWNYLATAKWVYTLPVLNFCKIFEMPVLGYLGFPPFALEAR